MADTPGRNNFGECQGLVRAPSHGQQPASLPFLWQGPAYVLRS